MRHSRLLIPTAKVAPAEAQAPWLAMLWRGGFVRRAAGGALSWLPLGMRVLGRIAHIVRQELAHAGAAEVRLRPVGDELPIVDLMRREVHSYRQLPLHLFQALERRATPLG